MKNEEKAVTGGSEASRIAIAVRKGKFQVQRVTYDSKGVSTIERLSEWISAESAKAVAAKLR